MPNDAKLGLVLGVGLTITVAVLFFRKDAVNAPPAAMVPEVVQTAPKEANVVSGQQVSRQVPARTASRSSGRKHIVVEGDTLFSLAEKYYQDKSRFVEIYQANREVLSSPDQLPAGTELTIP
jgi:nucleoid-associated protein YgaU